MENEKCDVCFFTFKELGLTEKRVIPNRERTRGFEVCEGCVSTIIEEYLNNPDEVYKSALSTAEDIKMDEMQYGIQDHKKWPLKTQE